MALRWRILVLLFLARTTMAFQFQAVATLSPEFQGAFAVGIADVGVLIGLYFAPGMILASPGGALGQRFGDRRVVMTGMAMMTAGGLVMAFSDLWSAQLAGRLVAGVGGILLNVLMTKMVADWFERREIGFSLALFVNSYPVGIASALIVLPLVAEAGGLTAALLLVSALTFAGFLGIAMFYRTPETTGGAPAVARRPIQGPVLWAVLIAGSIWGLYNGALAIVFSFGPELFVQRGMDLSAAGSLTSIILWGLAIFGTVGGFLVDWTGRRHLILAIGNLSFALFVYIGSWTDLVVVNVLAMALVSGLAVGAMMSLPALVLSPANRAVGMGIFFTLLYVGNSFGPMMAGWLVNATGDIASTYRMAAALLVASVLILPVYQAMAARTAAKR